MARATRREQVQYGRRGDDLTSRMIRDGGQGIAVPGLAVVANGVNGFVNPAMTGDRNAGAKTAQLAQALSGIAPQLMQFAGTMAANNNARLSQDGQNAASEAALKGQTYKQAVDAGILKRSDNPFFIAGVNEQYGRVMADRMQGELSETLSTVLQSETDATKVPGLIQKAQDAWMATNIGESDDRHFSTGFSFRAAAHLQDMTNSLVDQVGKNLESKGAVAIRAEARGAIVTSLEYGVSINNIASELNAFRQDMLAQGRSANDTDRALQEAIGSVVQDSDQGGVEKLFDLVTGSEGLSLRDAFGEKGADYARNVEMKSAQRWRTRQNDEASKAKQMKEDRVDEAQTTVISALMQNPSADISGIIESVKDIPGAVKSINDGRKIAEDATRVDDPSVEAELFTRIWENNGTKREVFSRMASGSITLQTADKLLGEIRTRDGTNRAIAAQARSESRDAQRDQVDSQREYRQQMSDPAFVQQRANLKMQFSKDLNGKYNDPAQLDRALAELSKSWVQWRNTDEGASADGATKIEWLNRQSTAMVGSYMGSKIGGDMSPMGGAKASTPVVPTVKPTKATLSQADIDVFFAGKGLTPSASALLKGLQKTDKASAAAYMKEQRELLRKQK